MKEKMVTARIVGRRASDPKDPLTGLGPLESRIMEMLWARGEAAVADVANDLSKGRKPAYTTVMTVMSRLFDKGLLVRESRGRAYIYRPACTKEQFLAKVSQSKIRSLVNDFGEVALAQFVEEIERTDPERMRRLAAILDKRERT